MSKVSSVSSSSPQQQTVGWRVLGEPAKAPLPTDAIATTPRRQLGFGIGRIHLADGRGTWPDASGVCLRTAHLSPPAGQGPRRGPRR